MGNWLKQKTTGIGFSSLISTGLAYSTGQIDGKAALSTALFSLIMLVWPEETAITKGDVADIVRLAAVAAQDVAKQKEKTDAKA